jgi:RNA polymerase sigma-70 factor (ECF subfamily)
MHREPNWLQERHRRVLHTLAFRLCLDKRLRRRFDESDLVHEALLKALEKYQQFKGNPENDAELLGWLHKILLNTFRDLVDYHFGQKRDPRMEEVIQGRMQESSARLEGILEASQSSPSERLEREERDLALANALGQLPKDQREVIVLRHLLGMPVQEIVEQLGSSKSAVGRLLTKGLLALGGTEALRKLMPGCE